MYLKIIHISSKTLTMVVTRRQSYETNSNGYYTFVETNHWECETWRFYFPVPKTPCQKDACHRVAKRVQRCGSYRIDTKVLSQESIDVRMMNPEGNASYMHEHNLIGEIDFYKLIGDIGSMSENEVLEQLYKGRIKNYSKGAPKYTPKK